ncbi:membrane protein [Sphaerisporangium rufum]|uniref:Membrane protein n=1 Tax=Sphaerisporangium rufum TaxID=1381558 RepID=A0A919R8Q2_9ACTN|nr:EamA family transporter [Sphaerisporangium rufum]GII79370.1 membrane protein [Sphaerisporangium rufum]
MRPRHFALAVTVAVIWGVNFAVIEIGLRHFPPLLFAALRFTLVALPAIFLVPRPAVPVRWIVAVGLFLGAGQFGLLFTAMHLGLPAGLASLVMQSQVIFTLGLAAAALGERPGGHRIAGVVVASAGILVIALGRGAHAPLLPLLLALGGAASWGAANVCIRKAEAPAGLGLLVWSSLVPPLPLLALSVLVEGGDRIGAAFSLAAVPGPTMAGSLAALAYVVVLSTFVGFGAWNALLRRYPAGTVAPFTMLVPVVGMATAWLWLGERLNTVELLGGLLVLAGLAVTRPRRPAPAAPERAAPATSRP